MLWVFGDFVLDLVVELNLETSEAADWISVSPRGLHIRKDTVVGTTVSGRDLYFRIRCPGLEPEDGGYWLTPGKNYVLDTPTTARQPPEGPSLHLLPRNVRWGGGGFNLVDTIRSISGVERTPDMRFTAVSNRWRMNRLLEIVPYLTGARDEETGDLVPTEEQTRWIVSFMKRLSPDLNFVELQLAQKEIEFAFLREGFLEFGEEGLAPRCNLVISRVTSQRFDLKDRIIFKSPRPKEQREVSSGRVREFFEQETADQPYFVLNSVGCPALFTGLLTHHGETHPDRPGLLALTKTNQRQLEAILSTPQVLGRYALVLNDTELVAAMLRLLALDPKPARDALDELLTLVWPDHPDDREAPFRDELRERLQPLNRRGIRFEPVFAMLRVLRALCPNRLYLTLGRHGSIGVDEADRLVHVRVYGGDGGFDTTGLGDAWASAVTLLRYHQDRAESTPESYENPEALSALEMLDELKLAAAVAYARFRDPGGRVFLPRLLELLNDRYVPATDLGTLDAPNLEGKLPPRTAGLAYHDALKEVLDI